ncbi:hypothetical protein ABZX38_32825 [Streptomyces longwoodensis]|uniref:hypothetical protein n=1 Tax=Streptomyces longwoodensis TaxID=68231 RepID=UPI0033BF276E
MSAHVTLGRAGRAGSTPAAVPAACVKGLGAAALAPVVRDRLRVLTEDRGTTTTELLKELASRELTEVEPAQRAAEAARANFRNIPNQARGPAAFSR